MIRKSTWTTLAAVALLAACAQKTHDANGRDSPTRSGATSAERDVVQLPVVPDLRGGIDCLGGPDCKAAVG
jgi:hypothetical protein